MQEAEALMKDEFFDDAREQLLRIKTEFPNSSLQAVADLRIADSYFQEESYAAAADAYEDFIKTYPRNEKIPYALYRMGMSYAKRIPDDAQRDLRSAQKAIDTFTRLVVDYSDSEYTEEAVAMIDQAQNLTAKRAYDIGRYYQKKAKYLAAANRYAELVELHPDHPLAEESFARRIECLLKEKSSIDLAKNLLKEFKEKYPNSNYLKELNNENSEF